MKPPKSLSHLGPPGIARQLGKVPAHKIIEGLEDAIAFAGGDKTRGRIIKASDLPKRAPKKDRHKDPDKRRAYMRELMRKRRQKET